MSSLMLMNNLNVSHVYSSMDRNPCGSNRGCIMAPACLSDSASHNPGAWNRGLSPAPTANSFLLVFQASICVILRGGLVF